MLQLIYGTLADTKFMTMALTAIAAAATAVTIALPFLETDSLGRRMKAVAVERDKIRSRERERMNKEAKVTLRQAPKAYMKDVVDRFRLGDWLGTGSAKRQLTMAGYRGQSAEVAFLFFRLVLP